MFGSASRTLTMILAGDIGGTKTRIALFREAADQLSAPINQQSFPSQQYESLNAILKLYLSANSAEVTRACFGIAGPIVAGRVEPGAAIAHISKETWGDRVVYIFAFTDEAHHPRLYLAADGTVLNEGPK